MSDNSPEWQIDAVARQLANDATPGHPSSGHVFLNSTIRPENLNKVKDDIVQNITSSLNLSGDEVKIERVRPAANSFIITSEVPGVFTELAKQQEVSALIDRRVSEMNIAPVDRTPVEF